ncbi:hypothetical protein HJG60_009123 [Phyllostomus discolor]|uniref:Uncharacterized protein n=1 Tax=Phyllostomus discolor TaxID=89673 RepID=A0A834DF12_9CHIR|nr:hypothetical protein HJG60_009123 [Phyllostomus discolor]
MCVCVYVCFLSPPFNTLFSVSIFSVKKPEALPLGTVYASQLHSQNELSSRPQRAQNGQPFRSHMTDTGSWYISYLRNSFAFSILSIFFLVSLSRSYNFIIRPQISISAAGRLAEQAARTSEVRERGQVQPGLWNLS